MSKRDYQAIARAIARAIFEARAYSAGADRIAGITSVTERIADYLAADNPRFDRARFVEACETGGCKGMPKRRTAAPRTEAEDRKRSDTTSARLRRRR